MIKHQKLIVSHAPFWHSGKRVTTRSYHTILAALPAVILGILYFGVAAVGVMCLSVSSAMIWELAINLANRRRNTPRHARLVYPSWHSTLAGLARR